jgi:hypothetical protein
MFEQGEDYVLSYKFSVDEDSDSVTMIAGHSPAFTTNKAIVDGVLYQGIEWSYSSGYPIDNTKTEHEVTVFLTCDLSQTDKSLYV